VPTSHTIFTRYYDELVVPGKPLGRHVMIDSRSALYPFVPRGGARRGVTLADIRHVRHISILDQGNTGSCTGNAETGALGCDPLFGALPAGHPVLDETFARDTLYHLATTLDPYPGAFPPEDTGSDGTSVCKAAMSLGFIAGYTHCQSVADVCAALMETPVIFGVDWYEGFDSPDSSGLVQIAGAVRGGHEIVCTQLDVGNRLVVCDNSWGEGYGVQGRFAFSWDTLEQLLSTDGDATVSVPLTAPAPTPTPTPADPVQAYFADPRLVAWSGARHTGENKYAAQQFREAKGKLPATPAPSGNRRSR
jgi:hypothetical protein